MRILLFFLFLPIFSTAQSAEYQKRKADKLAKKSPFERIAERGGEDDGRPLEYEDDEIIAFKPLGGQAPVHFLIVPKKRIPTINDLSEEDALFGGADDFSGKGFGEKHGIDETGYRLAFNTNEDSGQSVFHLHLHLMGGINLGPMVDQEWRRGRIKFV